MSRQNKLARKRLMRATATHDVNDKGQPVGRRRPGPASTTPLHGKKNRIPYLANHPKRKHG